MIEWTTLGIGSGIGVAVSIIAGWAVEGTKWRKKPNGSGGNTELLEMMHTTMRDGFKKNTDEHTEIFGQVREIREKVFTVRNKVSILEEKAGKTKKTHAKPLRRFECLVLDDQPANAESTAKILESYLTGILNCTHVTSTEEAEEKLKEQEYDLAVIDYFLGTSDNGYDVYKFFSRILSSNEMFNLFRSESRINPT